MKHYILILLIFGIFISCEDKKDAPATLPPKDLKTFFINPKDSIEYYFDLSLQYDKENQKEKSVQLLKRIISLDSNYTDAYYNLAMTYIDKKEYKLAIEYLKNVIRINPDDIDACGFLSSAYIKLKQYNNSSEIDIQILKKDKNNVPARSNLIFALIQLNRIEDAKKEYKILESIDKKEAQHFYKMLY